MKLTISISIAVIICLLNFAELKPLASDCVNHCLSNEAKAYKTGREQYYWCGINEDHADYFVGTACKNRTLDNCENDLFCSIVQTTKGKQCKGFCGACCSAIEMTGSCTKDYIPRCDRMKENAAKSKKLKLK